MNKLLISIYFALLLGLVSNHCYADCKLDNQVKSTEYCNFNLTKIRELANKGDKEAQFRLGLKYAKGEDLPKSDIEAVKWYEKASKKNQLDAMHNLAHLYAEGRGAKKDEVKSFSLEKNAAEQGHKYAQNSLGLAYLRGKGIKRDAGLAVEWLSKAANAGLVEAQMNLGRLYEYGDAGISINPKESFHWYQVAANSGDSEAQFAIGNMYQKGLQVKKSEKLALDWCKKSALAGNKDAWIVTGLLLSGNYEGITRDYKESLFWLKKSADSGDPKAYELVAYMYKFGIGTKKDIAEANKWYELAGKNSTKTKTN